MILFFCFFVCSECLTVFLVSTEAVSPLSRGAAGICSSTLQKLRGFTCLSEPSVDISYSEREQETHGGSGQKKSQVLHPPNVTHQPVNKSSRRQPEQENDDEEEEEQEEASSRPASSKKVPITEDVNSLTMCL